MEIDLILVNNKPVLHAVDTATKYQNSVVLKIKSTTDIWKDFLDCWKSVYIGLSEIITLDRESSFTSESFRYNAKEVVLDL